MIVGGYDLHVYCDGERCGSSGEYYGRTQREAYREARAQGWRFRGKEVFCDRHAGKQRKGKNEVTS